MRFKVRQPCAPVLLPMPFFDITYQDKARELKIARLSISATTGVIVDSIGIYKTSPFNYVKTNTNSWWRTCNHTFEISSWSLDIFSDQYNLKLFGFTTSRAYSSRSVARN